MADVRESFPSLEDGSQVGQVLRQVQEGDTVASKNGSLAFGFKKVSDNTATFGRIDDSGNLLVTMDGGGTSKRARGKVTGSLTNVTVCEISLTAGATYRGLDWAVSCFRDAVFEMAAINDPAGTPTEVILADALVGSGDYTDSGRLADIVFVAGATSPVLRLRALNLNATSDLRGAITTREDAA
jgi:hypothetical protein